MNFFSIKIICVYFLLTINHSFSQEITENYIDSIYNEYGSLEKGINVKKIHEIDSLSRSIGYELGMFNANLKLALVKRQTNPNITWEYIMVLDSLFDKNPSIYNDTLIVSLYLVKGQILNEKNNPISEVEHYIKADSIAELSNNRYLKNLVNIEFSKYYNKIEDYDLGLEYLHKVFAYYKAETDLPNQKIFYLYTMLNLSVLHFNLKDFDSTIYYSNSAIEQGLEEFIPLTPTYIFLSKSYLEKGEILRAKEYLDLINEIVERDNDTPYSLSSYRIDELSGDLYTALNEYENAEKHYFKALAYVDSVEFLIGQLEVNKGLLLLGLKKNNNEYLNIYFNNYIKASKNKYSSASIKAQRQLIVQYETGKKEIEIERLKYLNQLNEKTIVTIILSIVIVLLFAILIIVRTISKRKLLKEKLSTANQQKVIAEDSLNRALESFKEKANRVEKLKLEIQNTENNAVSIEQMTYILDNDYIQDNQWVEVFFHFDRLNDNFTKKLKQQYQNLTNNDIQLLILIQMNFTNKSIAKVKNVTESAIKKAKQRLLKKMDLVHFSYLKV